MRRWPCFLICGGLAVWLPNMAVAARPEAAAVFRKGFPDLVLEPAGHHAQSIYQLIGTNVFTSEVVQRLVRFLAFAYTYHYLNWFSKTSIIQWHAISKPRLAIVAVAWVASVAAYLIDYDLGLRWLFLLSLTHVVLEFPLNHKSFIDIGAELRRRLRVAA